MLEFCGSHRFPSFSQLRPDINSIQGGYATYVWPAIMYFYGWFAVKFFLVFCFFWIIDYPEMIPSLASDSLFVLGIPILSIRDATMTIYTVDQLWLRGTEIYSRHWSSLRMNALKLIFWSPLEFPLLFCNYNLGCPTPPGEFRRGYFLLVDL